MLGLPKDFQSTFLQVKAAKETCKKAQNNKKIKTE